MEIVETSPASVSQQETPGAWLWVEPGVDGGRGGWLGVSDAAGDTLSIEFRDLDEALSLIGGGRIARATDARVEMVACDQGAGRAAVVVRVDGATVFRGLPLPARKLLDSIRTTVAGLSSRTQERTSSCARS